MNLIKTTLRASWGPTLQTYIMEYVSFDWMLTFVPFQAPPKTMASLPVEVVHTLPHLKPLSIGMTMVKSGKRYLVSSDRHIPEFSVYVEKS